MPGIGTTNVEQVRLYRQRAGALLLVGGRASCKALLSFFACIIGTMNRGPSRAGPKAPINRTHSRRFAPFGDSRRSRSVCSACVFSAAFPTQAAIRWPGSWKAPTPILACMGTMNRGGFVAQAFEPAGSGDFPVARSRSTGLESPVNPQVGKPALQAGSWKELHERLTRFAPLGYGRHKARHASRPPVASGRVSLSTASPTRTGETPALLYRSGTVGVHR